MTTPTKRPIAKKAPAKKAAPVKKAEPVKKTVKGPAPRKATATKATGAQKEVALAKSRTTAPAPKPGPATQPALDLPQGKQDFIALAKIIPDPKNLRDTIADDSNFQDLVASVAQVGVLQPLLVVAHASTKGSYAIVAGHRRYAAAKKVGLKELPVYIRELSEEERVEAQLVENRHRNNLTPLQEATGLKFLLDRPGGSQRRVAERVGCDQAHVSRRVSLLRLPAEAQKALATDKITIGDALELVRLADTPDVVERIIKDSTKAKRSGEWMPTIDHQVSNVEHERKTGEEVAKLTGEQERLGVRILGATHTAKPLTDVFGWDVNKKMISDHAKEPCHAVVIEPYHGTPRVAAFCTDPTRHKNSKSRTNTAQGESTLKVPDKRSAAESKVTPAQRAEREATDMRRTFMRQTLTLRTPARASIIDIALRRYIEDAIVDERRKMADMLDLEPVQIPDPYDKNGKLNKDWTATIDQYIDARESNLQRACLAFAFVQGEWGYVTGGRVSHLAVLRQFGYELHDSEANYRQELDEMLAGAPGPVVVSDELGLEDATPDVDDDGTVQLAIVPELDAIDKHQYVDQASALCKVCDLSAGAACHWTDDRTDIIRDGVGDVDDIAEATPTTTVCKECRELVHFSLDHQGWVHTDEGDCTAVIVAVTPETANV